MTRSFRQLAVAVAAVAATSGAFAATELYEFKSFYDTSTSFNPYDVKTLGYSVATLKIEDIVGGVQLKLVMNDTAFPDASSTKKLYADELWLAGAKSGTIASKSGAGFDSAKYYSGGFTQEGTKYNYDIDFKNGAAGEGTTTMLTIKGAGVSTDTFGSITNPDGSLTMKQPIMLELANIGKPYTGLFGLNSVVHFIGTPQMIPEPSTYALMGLGLAGVSLVARKRKAA